MLLASLKSVLSSFPQVLGKFQLFVAAAAGILASCTALVTVECVGAARSPAVSTSLSHAGEAVLSSTLCSSPRVWFPVNVVQLCSSNFTNQEPYFSALTILLFFFSDQFG